LPFIPVESEIDQLIAGCGALSKQTPIWLQLLKETGMRMGEAFRLTWGDIDDVTKRLEETLKLTDAGFEYVTD
jgi:integrase